jgi:8-oxo-dGTP pyrophosphatase MutT (NUDIX family)
MNILTEIYRSPGIDRKGRTVHRTAVRGIALRGRELLMVHSSRVGDYKFPGGGVAEGESHRQALIREVREECGISIIRIGSELGAIVEYNVALEKDYDVFEMTSHYYLCEVAGGFGMQTLDNYEQELGFKPVWMDIDQAIQMNKSLLYSDKTPDWLRREIFVLEYIRKKLLPVGNV